MMDNTRPDVNRLLYRFDRAFSDRSTFSSHWQNIADIMSPGPVSFSSHFPKSNTRHIYDTTGIHSNELLASGFFSLLTNPTQPWFILQTNDDYFNQSLEMKIWLQEVSTIMAHEIQRPQTGFTTAMHEFYLEYGQFGNGTLFVTERKDFGSLLFSSLPLTECYYIENDEGFIDTLIRNYERTAHQLLEKFGLEALSEKMRKAIEANKFDDKFEIIHFIMPSGSARAHGFKVGNFPFTSIYISKDDKHILRVAGFEEQPFMAARFYKMPNEVYGRGPGSIALPDLRMLQEIAKTTLRGAQKLVDPPLQMPDKGFLTPPNTAPGSMNYYRAATGDRIEPLRTGGRPELGMELTQSYQNRVREIFFVDQLQLNIGPQMTATEVIQRTEEKQRLMGPVVGRAHTEGLSPLIIRSFGLCFRAGKFPEPPAEFMESAARLKIIYTSPIFKAQEQVAANNLMRMQQVLMPFQAADPTIGDMFHSQRIVEGIGNMFNIDPKFYRTPEELQQVQEERKQAQMAAANAEQLKNTGIGINNLASAGETLGDMSGMMGM